MHTKDLFNMAVSEQLESQMYLCKLFSIVACLGWSIYLFACIFLDL